MRSSIGVAEHCRINDFTNRDLAEEVCRYACKYHTKWLIVLGLALVRSIAKLYPNFALAAIITFATHYQVGESLTSLYWIVGLTLCAVTVSHIFQIVGNKIGYSTISLIEHDVRIASLAALHEIDMSWHRHQSAGTKVKKIEKAINGIAHVLREFIDVVPSTIVSFIGILAIIGQIKWEIGVLVGAAVAIYYALFRWIANQYGTAQATVNRREIELSGAVYEAINNVRSIKALNLSEGVNDVVKERTDTLHDAFVHRIGIFQRRYLLAMFTWFARIGILVVIAFGVMNGQYEVGFLVLFNNYFGTLIHNASQLSDSVEIFVVAREDVACAQDLMERVRHERGRKGMSLFPKRWREVHVEHLSFTYEGREILKDVSFVIKKGEKVGIVGLSAAGKSTLNRLLMNEYEHYEGVIRIDDVSLRDISRSSYHQKTAAVLQDPELFNLSLKENILLGTNGVRVSAAVLKKALRLSGVDKFLHKYPRGLSTVIGERGSKLSAGERQLVGIARALVKSPEILFLEKATSSLDFQTKMQEEGFFSDLFDNVTAVVVTNSPSIMKEMDRIIIMEDGQIIEQGALKELLKKKNGAFKGLWSSIYRT